MMIINPPDSGFVFVFMIGILQFLPAVALMCMLAANLDRMNVRSILKQAEKDIASGNYITKKIIYDSCYSEYFMNRLTEEEKAGYKNSFISMIMYDARNKSQTYRFNGKGVMEVPFEYGMILEITYLPKSKVINRVNIVQEA